jgi:hypothetical protein
LIAGDVVDYHNYSRQWTVHLLFKVSAEPAGTLIDNFSFQAPNRIPRNYFLIVAAERIDAKAFIRPAAETERKKDEVLPQENRGGSL